MLLIRADLNPQPSAVSGSIRSDKGGFIEKQKAYFTRYRRNYQEKDTKRECKKGRCRQFSFKAHVYCIARNCSTHILKFERTQD